MQIFQEIFQADELSDFVEIDECPAPTPKTERQGAFLANALRTLSTTFDYPKLLERIPSLVTPELADSCLIHVAESGRFALRAISGIGSGEFRVDDDVIDVDVSWRDRPSWLTRILFERGLRSHVILPLRARGQTIGLISFFRDATRPYTADETGFLALITADFGNALDNARLYREAKRVARTREDIMAVVSHDLKSPLTTISLQNHLIARAFRRGPSGPDVERYLACSERSIRRMERLITDLLDFMRVRGGVALSRKPQTARHLIEEASRGIQPHAEAKEVALVLDCDPYLPFVECDRDRVAQVFENLLGNAVKFSPPKSTIRVFAGRQDDAVRFSVADQGPGIPEENLPRVFETYWQAPQTAHLGSGLGLSIAREIVTAHGGSIWAENSETGGATISFTLPFRTKTA